MLVIIFNLKSTNQIKANTWAVLWLVKFYTIPLNARKRALATGLRAAIRPGRLFKSELERAQWCVIRWALFKKRSIFLKFVLFWRNALGDGISTPTRPKFQKCRRPSAGRPSLPRFFSQNSTEIITIFHEIQLIQLKTKNILFCIWSSGLVVWSWYSDKRSFLSSEREHTKVDDFGILKFELEFWASQAPFHDR